MTCAHVQLRLAAKSEDFDGSENLHQTELHNLNFVGSQPTTVGRHIQNFNWRNPINHNIIWKVPQKKSSAAPYGTGGGWRPRCGSESSHGIHQFLELLPDSFANPIHQGIPHMFVDLLEAHRVTDRCFPRCQMSEKWTYQWSRTKNLQ